jgi:hypothetical protein
MGNSIFKEKLSETTISTGWLRFYIKIWLPIMIVYNVIFHLKYFLNKSGNYAAFDILYLFIGSIILTLLVWTFIELNKLTLIGFILNKILLWSAFVTDLLGNGFELLFTEPGLWNIVILGINTIYIFLYFYLNLAYFNKRKQLFERDEAFCLPLSTLLLKLVIISAIPFLLGVLISGGFFMFLLFWCLSYMLGVFLVAFILSQSVLTFMFALPFTNFLDDLGALKEAKKIKRSCWFIILRFFLIFVLVVKWFISYSVNNSPALLISFMLGSLVSLFKLFNFKAVGPNPGNVIDYVTMNAKYFVYPSFVRSVLDVDKFVKLWEGFRSTSQTPMMSTIKFLHSLSLWQ